MLSRVVAKMDKGRTNQKKKEPKKKPKKIKKKIVGVKIRLKNQHASRTFERSSLFPRHSTTLHLKIRTTTTTIETTTISA